MPGKVRAVELHNLCYLDLIQAWEAAEIAGVSQDVIRQWAARGKIHRFPGNRRADGTMYARPEIEAIARQRAARLTAA